MSIHPLAGEIAPLSYLANIPRLISEYYLLKPDIQQYPEQKVSFGTNGHRGCAHDSTFNEDHVLAICQALCDYRRQQQITGPLFLGMDTHALSEPAYSTALQVLVANGVRVVVQNDRRINLASLNCDSQYGRVYTPTPVISYSIISHNRQFPEQLADGIVITPSHNPPEDGGLKYNGVNGGPATTDVTRVIQQLANQLLGDGLRGVKRLSISQALASPLVEPQDLDLAYIKDLGNVIDMAAISQAKIKIAVDPLGGSGLHYWALIAQMYQLDIHVVNDVVDPTFAFMTLDGDGKIRMDCSSPYAMQPLIAIREGFDVGIGNDPDYDRHGIVTKKGLLNTNHYLAAAIDYLFTHRDCWSKDKKVGKTAVSSSLIDRVVAGLTREVVEVPVGFKWFADGMVQGELGFGGEESAGGCFLKKDGSVWATDKDGFVMGLLAAEILAVTGQDPESRYQSLAAKYGQPMYKRIDRPATLQQKAALKALRVTDIAVTILAGETIVAIYSHAPGNNQSIGGLKIVTENGWFAARPSGTEPLYKIYLESFLGEQHLALIEQEATAIIAQLFAGQQNSG